MADSTVIDTSIEDASLMQSLLQNQTDALSDLYDRYGRLVYRIAIDTIEDRATVEEIVQDVFTRAWEKANTYDPSIARVSTWLIHIARNRSIDELRRERVRPENMDIGWAEVATNDSNDLIGPEEEAENKLQNATVRDALNTLSPTQREVVKLVYFKGYPHRRVAQVLGIPLGTVKTRLRLALQKLRLALSSTTLEDGY